MKFLYLCSAGLLLALTSAAQRNYVPATLLLRSGDSLSGQIDYRKWDASPLLVAFRGSETAASKDYAPADIKGFRIAENNETYISLPAVIDITNETVDVLSESPDRDTVGGEHFFRVLMDGPVKLLLYEDRFHRQHFSIMERDSVTHLVKKRVYVSDNKSADYSKIRTYPFYRQQLVGIVKNCVSAQRLGNLDYSETDLRKALQQYVACRYPGQQMVLRKEEKDMRPSFGVIAGAGLNIHHFVGLHPLALGKYGSTVSPVLGVFMDLPISRNREKLSWNNEVIYTTRAFSGSYSRSGYRYEVDVNLNFIQIQTQVKYTLPKGKLRPYLNAGIAGAINIGGKDELLRSRENGDGTKTSEEALEGGREFFLPLMAGVGVRYHNLHVEARFVAPHNLSLYNTLDASMNTIQLLVRYRMF